MGKIKHILFFIILSIGAAVRFYHLGTVPVGLHVDEAYFGYNAYSLLLTGKDMTGNFLPLHFASFLFSPAGYSYLSIPWVFIFGLSAFSTRFASAFFGTATLILTYFLAKKITAGEKYQHIASLAAMFFLAISPWHIMLSRTATENVVVVFFLALGTLLFLYWKEKKSVWYGLGGFASVGCTLLLYQAPRAFLPLFLPILLCTVLYKQKKKLVVSFLLYVVIIIVPLLAILHSPQLSQRITMLSVLHAPGVQLTLDEQIREDGVMHTPLVLSRLFHNKFTAYSQQILHNYFLHFSYDFLFGNGYLPMRYNVVSVGLLFVWELPLILLGIFFLLKKQPAVCLLLCGWIVLGPVGSALTFDDIPNMQRTLLIFPAVQLIEGFGIVQLLAMATRVRKPVRIALAVLSISLVVYSCAFFLHQYFVNGIIHRPWYRQEGTKELVLRVSALKNTYRSVVIGNADPNLSIFFLFYTKYNPGTFQEHLARNPQLVTGGHYGSIPFNGYTFDADGCPVQERLVHPTDAVPTVTGTPGILYVDSGMCSIPKTHAKVIQTIMRPDNTPAYFLIERLP